MGSIPHIYRRASFSQPGDPRCIANIRESGLCYCCDAVQRHQAHAGEALVRKTPIIAFADAFVLHTAEALSDPGVKFKELILDGTAASFTEINDNREAWALHFRLRSSILPGALISSFT